MDPGLPCIPVVDPLFAFEYQICFNRFHSEFSSRVTSILVGLCCKAIVLQVVSSFSMRKFRDNQSA
jgi:hypothetical protein